MTTPLVSVIVPTYNSEVHIANCLHSIENQSYPSIESIVVDNGSGDNTRDIALGFTDKVYTCGPERSAQRNYGVRKCKGSLLLVIDSDMELAVDVVKACVSELGPDSALQAVIIPEESVGTGLWAQCKRLERSFYVGVDWMEAARFFRRQAFEQVGGYDESMVSGEDWDLSQRIGKLGEIGRVGSFILHNEGRISLLETIRKKYYYAQEFTSYVNANRGESALSYQTGIVSRYRLFLSSPVKLFRKPHLGLLMLFMKTCEFGFGGMGYMAGRLRHHEEHT